MLIAISKALYTAMVAATPAGTNLIGYTNTAIGYTDSTTALGAAASFTGTGRSLASVPGMTAFNATAYADQAGTLYIERSRRKDAQERGSFGRMIQMANSRDRVQ